jgi:localization factor PodJL
MRSAPWHVKGIDPEARYTAREAARRSGVSVGQWLNSVILEQAADNGIAFDPDEPDAQRYHGDDLAAINDRLDDLRRQFALLAENHFGPARPADDTSQRIAEAILHLNGRLDQVIAEGRTASRTLEQRVNSVDRALTSLSQERLRGAYVGGEAATQAATYARGEPDGVDQVVAQIAARQRALDGEFAAPPSGALWRPSGAPVQCRVDDAIEALRKDLTDIGRSLSEAMPRRAVEALETQVRALGVRLDAGRQAGADAPALAGLEQGLQEVRDALRGLAPAESLVGFGQAVKALSGKIDSIAAGDPAGLQQLEAAIASLRGIVGQVASGDALAALAREVRALGDKIDQGVPASASPDVFKTLEMRIATIADAIEAVRTQNTRDVPPNLDHLVKSLNDKLERMQAPGGQLSRGDQLALGGLEDRIARLVEKLDASEGRLGHLPAIERGMGELLKHLEGLRATPPAPRPARAEPAPAVPVEAPGPDVAALKHAPATVAPRSQDSPEVAHGTVETVVDRRAIIGTAIRPDQRGEAPSESPSVSPSVSPSLSPSVPPAVPRPAVPAPSPPPAAAASPSRAAPVASRAAGAQPVIDTSLPHDHPLEPGSGPPRGRPAGSGAVILGASPNAADRIAASEAPLRAAKAAAAEPESKSGYLQAARRAAQVAQTAQREAAAETDALGGKLSQRLKTVFVGISVAVLIVVALRFAASYLEFADVAPANAPVLAERSAPVVVAAPTGAASTSTAPTSTASTSAAPTSMAAISAAVTRAIQTSAPLKRAAVLQLPPPAASVEALPTPAVLPLVAPPSFQAAMPPSGVLDIDTSPRAPIAPPPIARADAPRDVTGTVPPRPAPQPAPVAAAPPIPAAAPAAPATSAASAAPTASVAPAAVPPPEQLPAAIGGKALIAAGTAGEPAAAFEIANRFADGRGVPQNFAQAAVWYERATKGGLAPALFRLGALYEKGSGVAKDLNEARRLYVAAAEKGNSNAMHNLGVLYAEGIDGKPDFKEAAQWFRKSATFGISDSQYNLAVLYARGIGVERDLSEAYRWFALAAKGGDQEAGKKRDEIGTKLDPQVLAATRRAADTWVADRAPEDALAVTPPANGWDQAEPAAKIKPRPRAQSRPTAVPL